MKHPWRYVTELHDNLKDLEVQTVKQVGMGAEHMAKQRQQQVQSPWWDATWTIQTQRGEQCPWSSEGEGRERETEAQEPGRGQTLPGMPSLQRDLN